MGKLIIAANRLPFSVEKKGNAHEIRQSSGGLVSALLSLSSDQRTINWVGVADFKKDSWSKVSDNFSVSGISVSPLFVERTTYKAYYDGFSNGVLWPLFHYFPSYAEYREENFEAYRTVNRQFADAIAEIAEQGDQIWIHDYHLLLLPKLLKELRPELTVGFFLHIPFPSYEILKLIPNQWRKELLEGLHACDVCGVHTKEYLSHLQRSFAYFRTENTSFAQGASHSSIKAYPISIDFQQFNSAYYKKAVVRGRNSIRERHKDVKIIFSVDRLDYTKGVLNRLQAFETLLAETPTLHQKVVFIINVVPSRDQIDKYAERKKLIEENIGRINGVFGSVNWQPIIYQYRHLTFNQLISFYTAADIAMVTPLRDGMNLVAKEFIASRQDECGVLILSEFAGAAEQLKEAILVNPNDNITMKEGLRQALNIPVEEQKERMRKMRELVEKFDINAWINSFLNDMHISNNADNMKTPHLMTIDEKQDIFNAYRTSKKRLLLFDYDGTLVPYYSKPADAVPTEILKQLLQDFSQESTNDLMIISGRDGATLEKWFPGTNVSYVAEHGAMFKRPDSEWCNFTDVDSWMDEVEQLMHAYAANFKGVFIEKKAFSIAFHYRSVELSKIELLKNELISSLLMLDSNSDFNVVQGNMVVEARVAGVDKGQFVDRLLKLKDYDYVLAIGDDTTDEDMFAVLQGENQFTVKVGITPTKAKCNLINASNVISFLDQLNRYANNKTTFTGSEIPQARPN